MNLNRDRLHTIGWGTAMAICLALTAVLTTRVNAVKSQVALADRQIAQLTREKLYLETEFETRANQQQLRAMNDVDFGYSAPTAGQYLKSERDLAMLGKPAAPDAPQPIRYAVADTGRDGGGSGARSGAQFGNGNANGSGDGASLAGRLIGVARANALTGEVAGGMPKPALKVASLNDRLSRLDRSARGATVGPASGGFGGERE